MHDEHAHDRRDRLLVNEVVEHDGRVVLKAVLEDHHGSRLRAIELLRDVDPVLAPGARIDLALIELRLDDLTGWRTRLHLRVGTRWRTGGGRLRRRLRDQRGCGCKAYQELHNGGA